MELFRRLQIMVMGNKYDFKVGDSYGDEGARIAAIRPAPQGSFVLIDEHGNQLTRLYGSYVIASV